MTAARAYGILLRLYPRSFRARFGKGMRETFAADYARARTRSRGTTAALWIRTIIEAIVYGFAERLAPANRFSPGSLRSLGRILASGVVYDCRDAFRSLRATPLVSAAALLSLALGIGANTALFSILNGLVLKPLPVRQPETLVLLRNGDGSEWTNPLWQEIQARQHELFDGAFAWSDARFNLSDDGPTAFATGAYASGGMFDVLGVHAAIGRTFTAADDLPGGGPDGAVAVISERLWRERFGGASSVIGRRLSLDGIPFTVVGVMPARFFGPDVGKGIDVIVPLEDEALIRGASSMLPGRWTWWLEILARRKPGQSIEQANAGLRAAQAQIRAGAMPTGGEVAGFLRDPLSLVPAAEGFSSLRQRYQEPLTIILIVVAVILMMACANIASLLLARAASRRRDVVVRLALGASRLRLARTLLLESLFLASAGAALGLVVARIGSAFLVRQLASPGAAVVLDLALDARVLTFTTATAVITALLFGLAPAVGVSGTTPNEILKQQGRGVMGDGRWNMRNALVVVQVALSLTLVAGAGLFVRTFASLVTLPLGLAPRSLLAINVNAQRSQAPAAARGALFERFRDAAESVPSVRSAALSVITPISGQGWNTVIENADAAHAVPQRARISWVNAVSPRFFATYGMTLIAGRDFSPADRDGAPLVAIVNEAFARKFFGGANPIGREFRGRIGTPSVSSYQVVGLVSDAVYRRLREGMMATLYIPLAQTTAGTSITVTVQSSPELRGVLTPAITHALGAVDGAVALSVRPFDDYISAASAQERLVAMLAAFFGALALVLAGLGLYGVTSYAVSRRRNEIGVRMALGAEPAGVVRLVLARVSALVSVGIVAGMCLSWWASRYVSASLLYGVTPKDTGTFICAALVLVAVAGAASWLPASRAARIDPADVLRET